jgi:putative hydrolase of the HAD superfamily
MDGTLLDLHFDNYFWQELLPVKWGERNGLDARAAKDHLLPQFRRLEGTLSWYCVEYWSDYLDMDILSLKSEIGHLIRPRPHSVEFLEYLAALDKPVAMVTNAHHSIIEMKFRHTGIGGYFEHVFCAHHFGHAKEEAQFWPALGGRYEFEPERTLLIDDNVTVLRSAAGYGIRHLLAVRRPDSAAPPRDIRDFPVLDSFEQLVPRFPA